MKKQTQGSILLLIATFIWGTAFVAQSVGMDHIEPFTFQAVRSLIAVAALLPVLVAVGFYLAEKKSRFQAESILLLKQNNMPLAIIA